MPQPIPPGRVLPFNTPQESSIGRILLDMGKLKATDAERILRCQKENNMRFGEAAQSLGLVTEADIQQVLARQFDYPYLQPGQGNFASELVAAYAPFSPQVETLRAIRSQVTLRWLATGRKSFTILSLNPGEGVSLFAANLAVVFSQLGEETLLIDANLRRPRQHQIFNLTGNKGLSDILAGRADLGTILKVEPFVDLSVLQAGTPAPNPQELISRPFFADFHSNISGQFGVTIYDAPAFSGNANTLAIAAQTGGVLLVVRKDNTTIDSLTTFTSHLNRVGAEIIGTVMVNF
jgi:protein-tyrosine kinase